MWNLLLYRRAPGEGRPANTIFQTGDAASPVEEVIQISNIISWLFNLKKLCAAASAIARGAGRGGYGEQHLAEQVSKSRRLGSGRLERQRRRTDRQTGQTQVWIHPTAARSETEKVSLGRPRNCSHFWGGPLDFDFFFLYILSIGVFFCFNDLIESKEQIGK